MAVIKNRVEHEFSIPPLELQAMRDASLDDVADMVTYAVENPEEVDELAAQQARGEGVDVPACASPAPRPVPRGRIRSRRRGPVVLVSRRPA